jgi:hypothetical protein
MKIKEYTTMSKINNVLVDLRNKVGIAGKRLFAETIIEMDDVEGRNSKAIRVMSVGLDVAQKAYLLHRVPRWI